MASSFIALMKWPKLTDSWACDRLVRRASRELEYPMNATTANDHDEEGDGFLQSVGHMIGYLIAIAALPPLAAGLPWHKSLMVGGALIAVVALMRMFLGMSVRNVLSKGRAKAVLGGTDMAALFLFVASGYTVFALEALRNGTGWAAFLAIWALAALGCSVRMLARARRNWFSESVLFSRFE
jgi:channel protein (hemolysin III family)